MANLFILKFIMAPTHNINSRIGIRLKALRTARRQTQDDVMKVIGLKDRQTVSAIENGERHLKGEELIRLIKYFKVDPDYFTDPFRLVGEGQFNWRQSHCTGETLGAYQERAGTWIALYRQLTADTERPGPKERRSLRLWSHSSFEQACAEGERLVSDYNMGDVPARQLSHVMENDFGILSLMVDADNGISGAACRLPEIDAVCVNRKENPGRRNFDLAHEFFHILTWDTMPPKHIEAASENGGSRVEKLANNFASALLMPRSLILKFGTWDDLEDDERAVRLREVADYFQVSVTALYWRLVALKLLKASTRMVEVPPPCDEYLNNTPPLFSDTFMKTIALAINSGNISVQKVTKILNLTRESLSSTFVDHGIPVPVTI